MKIIHTSDWHLGQKFLYNGREEEHQLALDWLLDAIAEQQAEGLIVAGDIFDIGNPPNYARRMYYRFLTRLIQTGCRHVVITGGNHDSPSMLDAPRELLQALNMYVIGAASEDIDEEVVEWRDEEGKLEAVIAAVPFLRDRDLSYSVAGESGESRINRIRDGIRQHYEQVAQWIAEKYDAASVPVIATGHLYASGAQASDRQDNIYIGNKENIDARQFPELFDYVALGHIHRPQAVGGLEHVRYSGSLIPLSFSETKDDKSICLLEFSGKELKSIQSLPVPVFRRLKSVTGSLEEVKESLKRFGRKEREGLTSWVEVVVELGRMVPQLDQILLEFTAGMPLELLKVRAQYPNRKEAEDAQAPELGELQPEEVFRMKCESYGSPPEEIEELVDAFRELQDWMREVE